jgi:hypothetical protein
MVLSPTTLARNSTANASSRAEGNMSRSGGPREVLKLAEMTTSVAPACFAPTALKPVAAAGNAVVTTLPSVTVSSAAVTVNNAASTQSNSGSNSGGFSAEEVFSLESEYALLTKEMAALTKNKVSADNANLIHILMCLSIFTHRVKSRKRSNCGHTPSSRSTVERPPPKRNSRLKTDSWPIRM